MNPNKLLAAWKGDKRFTQMAARAVQLMKQRIGNAAVLAAIEAEFGPPPTRQHLLDSPQPFAVYGSLGLDIEPSALDQLLLALRLPIAVRGALMPDAHPGYALPIGGVFAAHNAVAPAMVGVDIGCRMRLSIFALPPEELLRRRTEFFADLQAVTAFGSGVGLRRRVDHEVLDAQRWQISPLTRNLRETATSQLGSSGSGNHFAELVVGELLPQPGEQAAGGPLAVHELPLRFSGLLTHSGSRGVGHSIAQAYIRLAAQQTADRADVPRMYEWLDLDTEAGQEYWAAMELAGAFAHANHEVIHTSFARRSRLQPLAVVENFHNFAWREGELVIHRKGATPAERGTLGVIPGSMASPAYVIEGLGADAALNSAAHGAGRVGSRSQARSRINPQEVRKLLEQQNVLVSGLAIDESPQAYKDIERVMQVQIEAGLLRPLARLHPVAVIMAGESGDS